MTAIARTREEVFMIRITNWQFVPRAKDKMKIHSRSFEKPRQQNEEQANKHHKKECYFRSPALFAR